MSTVKSSYFSIFNIDPLGALVLADSFVTERDAQEFAEANGFTNYTVLPVYVIETFEPARSQRTVLPQKALEHKKPKETTPKA
jgi:hypothetical protein